MATFNRGRNIVPSVRSVLAQEWPWYELIVVGDGCTDETPRILNENFGDRVKWVNLSSRMGSQSYPNNAGIALARGSHIAYLGHDDIWAPDHLTRLAAVYDADPKVEVAVSGCAFHLPHGMPAPYLTGLFYSPTDAERHFFPPSSFSHRRNLTDRIGPWGDPLACRAPVDCDLLRRAVAQGCLFRSTGSVTTHKFAAGHRYLSYLWHDSVEQEAVLRRLSEPNVEDWLLSLAQASRSAGRYMAITHDDYSAYEPGEVARQNLSRKGLQSQSVPLTQEQIIPTPCLPSTQDWRQTPDNGILWSIGNPRPRILVPASGPVRAIVLIEFAHAEPGPLARIEGQANGMAVQFKMGPPLPQRGRWIALGAASVALRPDAPTALELFLTGAQIAGATVPGLGHGRQFLLPAARPDLAQISIEKNRLGVNLSAKGEKDASCSAFRAAVAASALHVEARSNFAIMLEASGNLAEALDHAWIAATLRPEYLPAWITLARLALAENAVEAAEHIAGQIDGLVNGAPIATELRNAIRARCVLSTVQN